MFPGLVIVGSGPPSASDNDDDWRDRVGNLTEPALLLKARVLLPPRIMMMICVIMLAS